MREQRLQWKQEHILSVAEAMETPQSRGSTVETPQDLPAPKPHLPLRKASAEKLQGKRPPPIPIFAHSGQQLRGFNPSPVHAQPKIDNVTASSEHAFAGKDESKKKPFKPPLGVLAMGREKEHQTPSTEEAASSPPDGNISRPPSSPLYTPPVSPRKTKTKRLKSTRSVGEGLRRLGSRLSSPNRARVKQPFDGEIRSSVPVNGVVMSPVLVADEMRSSVPVPVPPKLVYSQEFFRSAVTGNRSAVTSNSSFMHTSSTYTEHSSRTRTSSHASDFVQVYPDWPETTPEADTDDEMTVEDAIGMYADGFESSARPSMETEKRRSHMERESIDERKSIQDVRPPSQQSEQQTKSQRPNWTHRRSQSASLLLGGQKLQDGGLAPPRLTDRSHTFSMILSAPVGQTGDVSNRTSTQTTGDVPRDRYGFKKASLHITAEQYDAWDTQYSLHLERRRKKWHALMQAYGLTAPQPFRFPPKSDKIKRYVRKGIPPEFRGAAWFWYAGGPGKLAKEPGLYHDMLEMVREGQLSDSDKEHIERDLNRTFPDNIRFKPDPSTMMDAQTGAGGGYEDGKKSNRHSMEPETPILQALRRVLQAFAVHNPHIGYCQSLNFIAGLLLLFLDEDEEKAFILLNIVTSVHLPGTHGVALEGANIDIAVLMSCVRDSLPAIWARLDDNGGAQLASSMFPGAQALRLPTVSLATTAWFMSLFVGTLPIESVLRIWDCLFFEGSKTLFHIALGILKFGERQILAVNDPIEIFQVVQAIPRSMLDINGLMEVCFRRRGGFGHISQGLIESRREERRQDVRDGVASIKEGRASVWRGRWRAKAKG